MHHIMQFFAEIRQKIVGGGVKKSVKSALVAVVLCIPQIALADINAAVKTYFGIVESAITQYNVSNLGGQKGLTIGDTVTIQNPSVNNGTGKGIGYLMLAGQKVIDNELTGVFMCYFRMDATVNKECESGISGCIDVDYKRVGHLTHSKSSSQWCQWFCADGWTGINKATKPENPTGDWLAAERDWCATKIDKNNVTSYAGTIDNIADDVTWATPYYGPDSDGSVYKSWEAEESLVEGGAKITRTSNTLGSRYIIALSYVTRDGKRVGIRVQPVNIVTYLTRSYYIKDVTATPIANYTYNSSKTFCLPGYTGDDCHKIQDPTPCAGKEEISLGSPDGDGWRSVGNNTGNQTKGGQYCVCTSTTDMSTCKYRILNKDFMNSIKDCKDISLGWCKFTVNNTEAYKESSATARPPVGGGESGPTATDVENRCAPGYYGNFSFGNSGAKVVINGGCTACPDPDFVGKWFDSGETRPTKDTDWKWIGSGINFGNAAQLCKIESVPKPATDDGGTKQCDGNYILLGDKCYARFKDEFKNYFIIPANEGNNGTCAY